MLSTPPRFMVTASVHSACRQGASYRRIGTLGLVVGIWLQLILAGRASEPGAAPAPTGLEEPRADRFYLREFRVTGVNAVPKLEVEEAVYPYLGPLRTDADLEAACLAIEKLYQAKGFQAVSVEIAGKSVRRGVVLLKIYEGRVANLRVIGSRYSSLSRIKARTGSLAEGKVIDFNAVNADMLALNQWPDRQVTPTISPGEERGTYNVDLEVTDTFPLHGSLELNNRYSADTEPLRLNASLSYNNLWQAGHAVGGSWQISPEDTEQVSVFSGFYAARFPRWEWLTLTLEGSKQNSNVSTLGSTAVAGRGESLGARLELKLPPKPGLDHAIAFGIDYKHYNNAVTAAGISDSTPITYYPLSIWYRAALARKRALTELNAGLVFGIRGFGSDAQRFDQNRYSAQGNFIYLRGDLAHTQPLPSGFELFAKLQGQIASQPLVSNEQYGGGGLSTVRGYLEAEVIGDNAAFGSLELRSPELLGWFPGKKASLQVYAFGEGGVVTLRDPLPEQENNFELASFGFGTRMDVLDYLHGSLDVGIPLISQVQTSAYHPLLTFRLWADF